MAVNRKVINSCPISSPASWPASISRLCLSWGFAPPLGRVYMLLVLRIQHFTQLRTKTRQLFGNEWTENKFTQRREKKKRQRCYHKIHVGVWTHPMWRFQQLSDQLWRVQKSHICSGITCSRVQFKTQ